MKLSESKATRGVIRYYLTTEGEGWALQCLCMVMVKGKGGWLCDDIR